MNENEMIEFEGRQYVNPDISRDEQMAFIDTMRDIQAQNNAQIATETHNLGTDIESTRGGLTGSEEYWRSLYQTPQTNAAAANMKAVAQQTALNNALSNYQNALQERYNQAYRNYQKRAYNYSRSGGGGGGTTGNTGNTSTWEGEPELRSTDSVKKIVEAAVDSALGTSASEPPNRNDAQYWQTGEEQTEQIRENLQWPEWTNPFINVLKTF